MGSQAQVLWLGANLGQLLQGNQESSIIMINSSLLTFALALLADSSVHSANLGLPASGINDETANQDSFSLMTDEDVAKPEDFSHRRFPFIEVRLAGEDGTERIFILLVSIVQHVRQIGFLKRFWMVEAVCFLNFLKYKPSVVAFQVEPFTASSHKDKRINQLGC